MRRTKIICTLGPTSSTLEVIRKLIQAGMNVARLNFSHGSHEEHGVRIQMVREASHELDKPAAIMLDTRGPEIRTGKLVNGKVNLKPQQQFILTTRAITGDEHQVQISYTGLPSEVRPGHHILLADGFINLEVERVEDTDIICRVIYGGELGERKGVNIPGVRSQLPFLSPKDIEDIKFGLSCGIDFIAASFVRTPQDVLSIMSLVEESRGTASIIAKIESREGIENLDDIIMVADGVMVARGDLGVEIPVEEVPLVQKTIIEKCNAAGKPVIIATQMLESMITSSRPTRAEASDVANAILDGADALMLSAETAAGRYPCEAVETMARIAVRSEEVLPYEEMLKRKRFLGNISVTDAISYATCATAADLNASAIITATQSGSTARMVAKYRPQSRIIGVTPIEEVARRMNLVWGIIPLVVDQTTGTDEMINNSVKGALEAGLIREGDLVVITAGVPTGVAGTTNLIKVHIVAEVLLKGVGIGSGSATGPIRLVKRIEKTQDFNYGDILVTSATDRELMPLIEKAAALVVEEGGLTSHAAIVGLSLGIPVVVGVTSALQKLEEGTLVTVDAIRGQIYRGVARVL